MYKVFVEERTDELSRGGYEHGEYPDLESAQREVRAARWAYPAGAAWVEDEDGKVIPTPEHPTSAIVVGAANCGCVYHTEDGIACRHDALLAR